MVVDVAPPEPVPGEPPLPDVEADAAAVNGNCDVPSLLDGRVVEVVLVEVLVDVDVLVEVLVDVDVLVEVLVEVDVLVLVEVLVEELVVVVGSVVGGGQLLPIARL